MKRALPDAQLFRSSVLAIGTTALVLSARVWAADWPCWRGPLHNGLSSETAWLTQWAPGGPRRLWTAQVGEGYSAIVVAAGRVYTLGNTGNQDTVYCLNAQNGQVMWKYSYSHPRRQYMADPGPNAASATPTVDGNKVLVMSREGLAVCLNADSGKPVWQNDVRKATGAQVPRWGFSGSHLVDGNLAIVNVGSNGVGLDKSTGRIVWKSGTGVAGYATPVPFALGQQRGVAIFTANAIVGVTLADGRVLWQYPWPTPNEVNAADPIFAGDSVFISSGYNRGCALIRVVGGKPSVIWENRNMKNHFNSSVVVGGYLFGNDQNTLRCLDLKTGQERWSMRGMGQGGLIAANGHLIVMTERGELKIIKANPDKFSLVSSAQVLRGTCWIHPVLANGFIFVRNREGELACLDVRAKK